MIPRNAGALPLVFALGLAACADQTEPEEMMLTAEPIFNKFGEIEECERSDGLVFPPGTAGPEFEDPCAPPEDCDDGFFAADGTWICPEPDRRGSDDSPSDTGRDPTGAPGAGG